jgi:hypothetical protein
MWATVFAIVALVCGGILAGRILTGTADGADIWFAVAAVAAAIAARDLRWLSRHRP